MKDVWLVIKIIFFSFLSLFYESSGPMWISIELYHGDQCIDTFHVCPDKNRTIVSDTRGHGFKIRTKVMDGKK